VRVLHLIKTTHGAAWALRQLAVLRALGIDVIVALPSTTGGLAPRYADLGAEVVAADLDFNTREPWRLAAALRRCRALVDHVRPDLIHSHFVSTTIVARLALGPGHVIPRLFQVPGPLHLEHAFFRHLDLLTSGPRDSWVATCRWTHDEYLRCGVAPERLFLSYYGTDLARLRSGRPGMFRGGIGASRHVLLTGMVAYMYGPKWFLGQRRGIKGHEDFIEAFASLLRAKPDARAVIVGSAWARATRYEQRLRALAWRACGPQIHFTSQRSDIPDIYADLDVAVHPSLSENCGGAVESLAAACPTVATAVGGLPDVVIDGETGWLVPPRDPVRLAAAIEEALADRKEAQRRARAGRQLVRQLFDVERTGREIASIYARILGRDADLGAEHSAERPAERIAAATG